MSSLNGQATEHTGAYNVSQQTTDLYILCKDIAGNVNPQVHYTFTVDTVNPIIQFVPETLPSVITNTNIVNIMLTGTNSTAYKYKLITGNSCAGVVYDGATGDLSSPIVQ